MRGSWRGWLASLGLFLVSAILVSLTLDRNSSRALHAQAGSGAVTPRAATQVTAPARSLAPHVGAPDVSGDAQPLSSNKDEEFSQWLDREAELVNQTQVKANHRAEIERVAKNLTPLQARQLLGELKQPQGSAAKKVISTYLLVEAGSRGREEIKQYLLEPAEIRSPAAAHSENELLNVRDKSLRIMALDGLAQQAQSDPSARATLSEVEQATKDDFLRTRAREQLKRITR